MTTLATITGIATVTTIITTAIHKKPARFPGGAWAGQHCSWPSQSLPQALFKCARGGHGHHTFRQSIAGFAGAGSGLALAGTV